MEVGRILAIFGTCWPIAGEGLTNIGQCRSRHAQLFNNCSTQCVDKFSTTSELAASSLPPTSPSLVAMMRPLLRKSKVRARSHVVRHGGVMQRPHRATSAKQQHNLFYNMGRTPFSPPSVVYHLASAESCSGIWDR